ncbi:chromosome condensation complex protein [Dorcoceras hygrometricum]|uniref:Chromosome condensation complex protein n=1 Tax=Dorcoceras hygrometricum TaxID=472368 RepID=A0A2Z7BJL9_9LAMI|nr:chromosome condensation complex protein [Dorcoceras hygrometricum]
MASSYYTNTLHVSFESVLAMDNPGMVSMFKALTASGLQGFLGCPAAIYETALIDFFENALVRDGVVISTVAGKLDMVTPGTRQAKGYAIQISLLLENVPNLELGESSEFPSSKILTEKTVHRYVVLNDKAEPVVKKNRTTKSKPVSSKATLETLPVEAVPLQMIAPTTAAPTTAAPTEQPPFPKRKSQKRKIRLVLSSEDEFVDSEAAVGGTSVEQEPAVEHVFEEHQIDDVDDIIQQILTETAQVETDEEIETIDVEPTEELETVVVEQSADEAMSLEDIFLSIPVECPISSAGVEITKITLGNSIKIPGVNEGGWYKAGLPKIPETDKGKAPLQERDPVKGNPVKEQILLTLTDIECLVKLREQVIDEVEKFFNSFSLKKLENLKIDESYFAKEELVLSWAETDSTRVALNRKIYILTKYREFLIRKVLEARKLNFVPGEGSSATDLKIMEKLADFHMVVVEDLKEHAMAHGLKWEKTCCSKIFEGRPRDRGAIIARTNTNTRSSCWIRTMLCVDGVWLIEPCADHWTQDIRQIDDSQNNVLSKLHTLEQGLHDTLRHLEEAFRNLIHSARQDGRTLSDVQTLRLNEFRKGVLAHGASVTADLMDVRKELQILNAKVDTVAKGLDDVRKDVEATKEAISHQILYFRAQAQENHNILTDQLGQLVDYINRGGNDKKGEDSSRGPQPSPDDQDIPSGSSGNRGSGGSSGSQRRGQSSGQSKRRRSGGESHVRNVRYGPYPPTGVLKRRAEYWCTGKKDF